MFGTWDDERRKEGECRIPDIRRGVIPCGVHQSTTAHADIYTGMADILVICMEKRERECAWVVCRKYDESLRRQSFVTQKNSSSSITCRARPMLTDSQLPLADTFSSSSYKL